MPIVNAPRVNSTYIPYIAHDIQGSLYERSIYVSSHALASSGAGEVKNLESENDAKTGKQSIFGEIHTSYVFGTP